MKALASKHEFIWLPLLILGSGFVFTYLHAWAHGLGFWLGGIQPCVGLFSSRPAEASYVLNTTTHTVTFFSILFGPLFSLLAGMFFMVLHFLVKRFRTATFTFGMANLVPHFFNLAVFVVSILVLGKTRSFPDEALLQIMLATDQTQINLAFLGPVIDIVVQRRILWMSESFLVIWTFVGLTLLTIFLLVWLRDLKEHPRTLMISVTFAFLLCLALVALNYGSTIITFRNDALIASVLVLAVAWATFLYRKKWAFPVALAFISPFIIYGQFHVALANSKYAWTICF